MITNAWFNGDILPLDEIVISATDRGFLLGDGLFETIRVEQGHVFYLEKHLVRLDKSLMKLGFSTGYDQVTLSNAIHQLIELSKPDNEVSVIRISVSRGSGLRGLLPPSPAKPNTLITLAKGPENLPPAKLCYSLYSLNENAPSCGLKTLSYVDQVIAFEQAKRQNCDEALMFNAKGLVAEGTMSNLFFVTKDQIVTPGIWNGALPGVMRQTLLDLDPAIKEMDITRDMVQGASEIFMTNSLIKIRPVCQLEQKEIKNFPITMGLMEKLDQFETNIIQASTA